MLSRLSTLARQCLSPVPAAEVGFMSDDPKNSKSVSRPQDPWSRDFAPGQTGSAASVVSMIGFLGDSDNSR